MYQNITKSRFRDAFHDAGRSTAWTYEGLGLLFDYLEEMGESELDVIELDGAYCEQTPEEIADDFSHDLGSIDFDLEDLDLDEVENMIRDYLTTNTRLVGETATTFIYETF
jgi:hypothetical protein